MSAFAIDTATGLITLAHSEAIDFSTTSYSLQVKVSDGPNLSEPKTVNVKIADKVNICHNGELINISKNAALAHFKHGCKLGLCSSALQRLVLLALFCTSLLIFNRQLLFTQILYSTNFKLIWVLIQKMYGK